MNLKNLMVFVLLVSLVTEAVLTGGCVRSGIGAPGQETPAQIIENITSQEAFDLIDFARFIAGFFTSGQRRKILGFTSGTRFKNG